VKPHLVIGLGNRLMGDEAVGWHVIDRLARHPRLPQDAELFWGGTDLLACASQMEGRSRITLVDALLDPSRVGKVMVFTDGLEGLEDRQGHAHHLSVIQAIKLLRLASPTIASSSLRLIAIAIESAYLQMELSPGLESKMPQILERVLQELPNT
jgi:hydrogenase maturation protease